jgi:hypothetical protein
MGYDKETEYPLKGTKYRDNILSALQDKDVLKREEQKNLFGMTAFYRHDNTE